MDALQFLISLLESTFRVATPLLFAALGAVICERSGVINLALEGFMLTGAFTAAAVAAVTGNPWLGLFSAVAAGALAAGIYAWATIGMRAEQVVAGMAINILAAGATAFLSAVFFGTIGSTPRLEGDAALGVATIAGVNGRTLLSVLAFLLVPLLAWGIYETPWGLRLRTVGERPLAAEPAGVSVQAYRVWAIIISGILGAIGGAYLSTAVNTIFSRNMTAGRGYIALAAVILGRWHPVGAFLGCLLFGFADAIQYRIPRDKVPDQFLQMIPYVVTIVVLVAYVGRSVAPRALGKPYVRGRAE